MRSLSTPAQLDDVGAALRHDGWALMPRDMLLHWLPAQAADADTLHASWSDLPPDTHLRDGGHYRFRRHSCFVHAPSDPLGGGWFGGLAAAAARSRQTAGTTFIALS